MRSTAVLLVAMLLVGGVVYGAYTLWQSYESTPPTIELADAPTAIGRDASFRLLLADRGAGLARLEVRAGKEGAEELVYEETLAPEAGAMPVKSLERTVVFDPREKGLRDGPARLVVRVTDASRRGPANPGNVAEVVHPVEVRTRPPTLEILSDQHNIERGGSHAVAFRVGESATESGVRVGEHAFRAYPSPVDPSLKVSLFALPYDAPADVEPRLFAADVLGNRQDASFYHKVKDHRFPDETVNVPAGLIEKIRNEFETVKPSMSDEEAFLAVNHEQRREDHVRLAAVLARAETAEPLWKGAFLRLPGGAPMSAFAEKRSYLFEGREIDQARHLGVDLASLANSPVPAGEAGVVIYASELGIYGNTVVLDHGLGLTSLYAHLSSFAVSEGDRVERGHVLGRTGKTGLALGDHLHFGVYVNGLAVHPKEWWDADWIRRRIEPKIALWRSGGRPPATPESGAGAAATADDA